MASNLARFGFTALMLFSFILVSSTSMIRTSNAASSCTTYNCHVVGGQLICSCTCGTYDQLTQACIGSTSTPVSVSTSSFCNIVNTVRVVVGVVSLLLFVLGGVMYALGHILPQAGNIRGNMLGWSMGMIVGGIIGLIIVMLAPGIISTIATSGGLTTTTSC